MRSKLTLTVLLFSVFFGTSTLAQPFLPIELPKPNLYCTMVTDVAEDANGDLYIGTTGGLLIKDQNGVRYDMIDSTMDASGNYRPISIKCVALVRGKVWVGTQTSGAYFLNNGNWVSLNVSHGMPSNTVNDITEGGSQFTYLACNNGIGRFSGSIATTLKPFTNNQFIEFVDYHGGFLYASNKSRNEPIKKFSGSIWVDLDSIPVSVNTIGRNRAAQILFSSGNELTIKTAGDNQVLHYDGQQWTNLYNQSALGIAKSSNATQLLRHQRELYALNAKNGLNDTVCVIQPHDDASYQKAIPANDGGFWLMGHVDFNPYLSYVYPTANTWATLHVNEIRADFSSGGLLFNQYPSGQYKYSRRFFWQDTSQLGLVYYAGLWLQGQSNGQNCISATNGAAISGYDFMSGPVAQTYNGDYLKKYNRVWKVNKADINHHRQHFAASGYKVPESINNWPGNGDSALGVAPILAPFVDMNANGLYEPKKGDYPRIKGDQAVYFIFNDLRGDHQTTGGQRLGVEVHGMAYAIDTNHSVLENSLFINFKIINRGTQAITSLKPGLFNNFEIGAYIDDASGCNSAKNLTYAYNANAYDTWLGTNSPALGVCSLSDSLTGQLSFNRYGGIGSINQNMLQPENTSDFHNYMNQVWKDGIPVVLENPSGIGSNSNGDGYSTSGNFSPTKFHYDFQDNWFNSLNSNGEPMSLSTYTATDLQPGESRCFDIAYTVTPSQGINSQLAMLNSLSAAADSLKAFYLDDSAGCLEYKISLPEEVSQAVGFGLYPNPVRQSVNLKVAAGLKVTKLVIYRMDGTQVLVENDNLRKLNVSALPAGIYLLKLQTDSGELTERFIKQ